MEADRHRVALRHYALAALIVVVGLAVLADGASEGINLIAGGVIIAILARAVDLGLAPGGSTPRWLLVVLLVIAVLALLWAASEWQPRDGELPGRPEI